MLSMMLYNWRVMVISVSVVADDLQRLSCVTGKKKIVCTALWDTLSPFSCHFVFSIYGNLWSSVVINKYKSDAP